MERSGHVPYHLKNVHESIHALHGYYPIRSASTRACTISFAYTIAKETAIYSGYRLFIQGKVVATEADSFVWMTWHESPRGNGTKISRGLASSLCNNTIESHESHYRSTRKQVSLAKSTNDLISPCRIILSTRLDVLPI